MTTVSPSTTLMADVLYGGAGTDWLRRSEGVAELYAIDGSDPLKGGSGDDRLSGDNGLDTTLLGVVVSDYRVTTVAGVTTVHDLRESGGTGTDTLVEVGRTRFPDGSTLQDQHRALGSAANRATSSVCMKLSEKMDKCFTLRFTAQPEDIDARGHVNNAVWVRWMEEIAAAHWMADALPEHVDAFVWLVIRHEIDFRGNVQEGESVEGMTEIREPPRGARSDRYVTFRDGAGKELVRAKTTWAMIDRATGRPARVTAEVAAPFLKDR